MKRLIFLAVAALLSGCNPFYVMRAAYEQSKILLKREDIAELLSSAEIPAEEQRKLGLVMEAREFAREIKLDPGGSFTKFSRLDRDDLAWVLVASKPDSFELFTWWFPIVGSVPYKGYFEKSSVEHAAKTLEEMGYETYTRTTAAISTLGWFDDPLLSSTLRSPEHSLVNLVIHESLHSTVWIPGQVDFNESLANFVGLQGAVDFFQNKLTNCPEPASCASVTALHQQALNNRANELKFSLLIEKLFEELSALYGSAKSKEEKLVERERIFESHIAPLLARNPRMKSFRSINNAEIMQVKLYMTKLQLFEQILACVRADWGAFLKIIREIAEQTQKDGSRSAWQLLEGHCCSAHCS